MKNESGFNFIVLPSAFLGLSCGIMDTASPDEQNGNPKVPQTERGRRTRRRLLDAATKEFGEKGFHEGSITGITQRAGMSLGSFYTYFNSKDEVFQALVKDLSARVEEEAKSNQTTNLGALETERVALQGFLSYAQENKELYRIIDEAEFVDPETFRLHYETTAGRIYKRLQQGMEAGELRPDLQEVHAWAIMGMNVFLGLKFAVWNEQESSAEVAKIANSILRTGIGADSE